MRKKRSARSTPQPRHSEKGTQNVYTVRIEELPAGYPHFCKRVTINMDRFQVARFDTIKGVAEDIKERMEMSKVNDAVAEALVELRKGCEVTNGELLKARHALESIER